MYNLPEGIELDSVVETVFEDEDLKIALESNSGYVYAHLDIKTHTKASMKKLKKIFDEGKKLLLKEGHDKLYGYTDNLRLLTIWPLKGFEEITDFDFIDGKNYKVVCWNLGEN